MSRGKTAAAEAAGTSGYLKIGDVARLAGISPSLLRGWEELGLLRPHRSRSRYRLYTQEDVRLLRRALYLRRARGLNAPAILATLRREGMLSPAPVRQDGRPSLGPYLRRLRRSRGLSLAGVAHGLGLSVGFLSSLERSQMGASVGTLRKLAHFYRVNILDFFGPTHSPGPLVRPAQRKGLRAGAGVRMELLAWGDTMMEPHLFRIAPGRGSGDAYAHAGEEFLFVLRGELEISLEGQKYHLRQGDSFYFESATPHRWANPGKKETAILWINTPPTF